MNEKKDVDPTGVPENSSWGTLSGSTLTFISPISSLLTTKIPENINHTLKSVIKIANANIIEYFNRLYI